MSRFYGFGYTESADTRKIPLSTQIATVPSPGLWYSVKTGDNPWKVAKIAYGSADLKKGLLLMNAATWNDHVERSSSGWEAYNVKGLQFLPKYSRVYTHAPKGSGTDFPTIWVPPLDGKEPEAVFVAGIGPVGPQGPGGQPGESGIPGPPGPPPTTAQISAAVATYLQANPPPQGPPGPQGQPGQATEAAIRDAVNKIIAANPEKFRGAPGPQGPQGLPGQATTAAIQQAVVDYLKAYPPARGPQGLPGPMGPPGPAGTPGSANANAIMDAIKSYVNANPDKFRGPVGPMGPAGASTSGGSSSGGNNLWTIPAVAMALSWLK